MSCALLRQVTDHHDHAFGARQVSNFSGNVLALLVFTIYDIKKLLHLSWGKEQELREAEAMAKREAAEEEAAEMEYEAEAPVPLSKER